MSDYGHYFDILEYNAINQESDFFRTISDFNPYRLLEETIGFQHHMAINLRSVKDDYGYDNRGMCYSRCIFNTGYLYHASRILKSDDLPVFFTVIRTVFESIPKLFYCMRHTEMAKHVFCCEWFWWQKRKNRVDEGVQHFCKSVKKINCAACKYVERPRWFREEVYMEDKAKKIWELYNEYSENVHPTLEPIYASTRGELEYTWMVGLNRLTCLSLMNAFIMVNAGERGLVARGEYERSKSFIKYAMRKAGDSMRRDMARMYPNKDEYVETLPFALPNVG